MPSSGCGPTRRTSLNRTRMPCPHLPILRHCGLPVSRLLPARTPPQRWRVDETAMDMQQFLVTDIGCCRSEEHTSELQSLMRISYAVFCLTQTKHTKSELN